MSAAMRPLEFAKIAFQDWRVGALTVSSRHVVQRILQELKPDYRYIIEYGAGEGILTQAILRHLAPDAKIVAIERNPRLAHELKAIADRRLTVLHADAFVLAGRPQELGLSQIDVAISSIPLSFLPARARAKFLQATYAVLAEGGLLIVYQYTPLVLPTLRRISRNVRVLFEPRNLPPYFIMVVPK